MTEEEELHSSVGEGFVIGYTTKIVLRIRIEAWKRLA